MSKSSLPLFLLGWIIFSSPLLKADPAVVIPAGDLACSVVVTNHAGSPPPDGTNPAPPPAKTPTVRPIMTTATIVRVGRMQQDTFTWSNGTTSESWTLLDMGLTLLEDPTGPANQIYELPNGSAVRKVLSPPVLDLDAASVAWINSSHLTGKTTHDGKPAIHYQATEALYNFVPPKNVLYQAWVDPKTLAPLAFDDGDCLYELTFSAPPTQPLLLPDRFKKDLNEYLNANATPRHL
jgi:hypothetical protein